MGKIRFDLRNRIASEFLQESRARTKAIIASAITPAAGTTQVSLRSKAAGDGFLLMRSTDINGRRSVGIGFRYNPQP